MPECFFAHLGGCEGRLVKAHLIPKSPLSTELKSKGISDEFRGEVIWDPRVWRWMCGSISRLGGHHGQFDSKQICIPPEQVPPDLIAYLAEYDLEWMAERYL